MRGARDEAWRGIAMAAGPASFGLRQPAARAVLTVRLERGALDEDAPLSVSQPSPAIDHPSGGNGSLP